MSNATFNTVKSRIYDKLEQCVHFHVSGYKTLGLEVTNYIFLGNAQISSQELLMGGGGKNLQVLRCLKRLHSVNFSIVKYIR